MLDLDPFYYGEGDLSIEEIQTLRAYVWRGSPVIMSPKAAARMLRLVEEGMISRASYDLMERHHSSAVAAAQTAREMADELIVLQTKLAQAEQKLAALSDLEAAALNLGDRWLVSESTEAQQRHVMRVLKAADDYAAAVAAAKKGGE